MNLYEYIKINYPNAIRTPFKGYDPSTLLHLKTAGDDLLDMIRTLDEFNVDYRVIFGTLLGIYRDGDLIPYDNDMDLGIRFADTVPLIDAIPKLVSLGFTVIRYQKKDIITFSKNGDHIDLFIFKDEAENLMWRNINARLEYEDFEYVNTIEFKGVKLKTVKDIEKFFVAHYGNDWKVPKENVHGNLRQYHRRY